MRLFSDEVHEWWEHTLDVFVPDVIRETLHDLAHSTETSEKAGIGEFELTIRKIDNTVRAVSFIPDRQPVMRYDVPLEVLGDARRCTTYSDVENVLIDAGSYPVLLSLDPEDTDGEDDDDE